MILGTRQAVLGTAVLGAIAPLIGASPSGGGGDPTPISIDLPALATAGTVVLGGTGGLS
jgi:hypothetical protein